MSELLHLPVYQLACLYTERHAAAQYYTFLEMLKCSKMQRICSRIGCIPS